ncbi:hypothetical protein ANCCAN_29822 [Ancylostoma caninum]|uniref:Uncharacterized protein n=1 Tax=Ancylostoma caninum TaxID=29170 RepID=A0A368F0F8_ANCCA|nr:hypothetical protein ANCCAN_29822 [Ancylostoma caninum]
MSSLRTTRSLILILRLRLAIKSSRSLHICPVQYILLSLFFCCLLHC